MTNSNSISLYNGLGQRKYLIKPERKKFYSCAHNMEAQIQTFLLMLYYSGARISEVLQLEVDHIDFGQKLVIIESLKKRRRGVFRALPLPEIYLKTLNSYLQQKQAKKRVWEFTRRTASRYIKSVMDEAGINGIQASAKGLRHSFAVSAIENNIPLNLIRNWMGHSSIETTAIYLNVSGQEERSFAKRMWCEKDWESQYLNEAYIQLWLFLLFN